LHLCFSKGFRTQCSYVISTKFMPPALPSFSFVKGRTLDFSFISLFVSISYPAVNNYRIAQFELAQRHRFDEIPRAAGMDHSSQSRDEDIKELETHALAHGTDCRRLDLTPLILRYHGSGSCMAFLDSIVETRRWKTRKFAPAGSTSVGALSSRDCRD
jgi:hypothetical protein